MNIAVKLTTEPSVEPVTTAEAKDHLRLSNTADDDFIDLLITAARAYVEDFTGRRLINQTWTAYMDAWPGDGRDVWWDGVRQGPISMAHGLKNWIELPRLPLFSVTSIKTYSTSDVATTFTTDGYYVDTVSEPGRIALRSGYAWPFVGRTHHGIEIVFVAGYGAAASSVPEGLKLAIKMLVTSWYETREPISLTEGTLPATVPTHVLAILRRYKVARL